MHSKDVCTVRLTGMVSGAYEQDIRDLFARNRLAVIRAISVCPGKTTENAPPVGTVTFSSPSEAKKALNVSGQILGRSSIHIERDFMGLTVLAAPKEPSVDIIAVHGLNGHAYGTWAFSPEAKGAVEVMWLRDFLPSQVPNARIVVYGYNSALFGLQTSVSSIKDFATDLLQRIVDDRATATDVQRPIIFICHSLGGLVTKQALVIAHKNDRQYPGIFTATKSLIFFGTPHKGSRAANIALPMSNIAGLAFQRPPKQLLQTLKTDSAILSELLAEFNSIRSSFTIASIYERRITPVLSALVVDEDSSCLGDNDEVRIPIDATHSQMCRFESASDPLFSPILEQIKRCWRSCDGDASHESVPGSEKSHIEIVVPPANERRGVFLVPTSANPYFEGRTRELEEIEELLNKRRRFGASSHCPIVAIYGLGGIGKTQLATQYVYNRRARKPDSCTFWVSARSQEELQTGLESVLRKLALDPTRLGKGSTIETGLPLLKSWMALPESGDWLLVLDNYDKVEVKLDHLLPTEAVGSVLITSRDRKIIGSVANSGFSLNAMDELDAQYLFLRLSRPAAEPVSDELGTMDETQALHDILKELQYFPLAIDQAASFIRENSPMTVREYLDYLKPRTLDRERLLRFKQARPEYPDSVMTTWEISLEYLNKANPRASWILQLLGFLDNKEISEDLLLFSAGERPWVIRPDDELVLGAYRLSENARKKLANLKRDVGFREAIGILTSLSLIQRNTKRRDLNVHPLVHEWIRVRLNLDPKIQADWTITAALVLFQTFPCESFTKPSSSWKHTTDTSDFFYLIKDHVDILLDNLDDYMENLENLPVECYILCETLLLAAPLDPNDLSIDPYLPSCSTPEKLSSSVQSMMNHLSSGYEPIASFIHRLIMWIRKKGSRRGSDTIKHSMADTLQNLRLTGPIDNSRILFLMLLAQAVVKVTACRNDRKSGKMNFWNRKEEAAKEQRQERQANAHLFAALQYFLELTRTDQKALPLLELTHMETKRRLLECTSPREFIILSCLRPSHMLSSDILAHISHDETGKHICRLAHLLWNFDGPKDYEGIKLLFSVASKHWKLLLAKEHRRAIKEAEESSTMCQPISSYISSSFGRSMESELRFAKDLKSPLSYFWEITPIVAMQIANPNVQWTTRQCLEDQSESSTFALSLTERRSAERLYVRVRSLYLEIDNLGHSGRNMDAISIEREPKLFRTKDSDYTLTQIYVMTGKWHSALWILLEWLQCRSVIEHCEKHFRKGAISQSTSSDPRSSASSDVSAAAASLTSFSAHSDDVNQQQERIKWSHIRASELPKSLDSLSDPGVDDMISAFLIVANAQGRLSDNLKLEHEQKMQQVEKDPRSDRSCLQRLRIIYELAQMYYEKTRSTIYITRYNADRLQRYDEVEAPGIETCSRSDTSLSSKGSVEDNKGGSVPGSQAESSDDGLDFEW